MDQPGIEIIVRQSRITDPEGHVISDAGEREANLTAVLDLDLAANARRYGTAGLNRLWTQIADDTDGLELPMYGGRFRPRS